MSIKNIFNTLFITKLFALAMLFSTIILFATSASANEKTFVVLPSESSLSWIGKKVTGQHEGTVKIKSGSVKTKNDTITGGEFELDMNSITVTDIKDEKNNKKLLSHLLSDDFFATTPFPTAMFTLTKAARIHDSTEGGVNYTLTGLLNIKGISQEISFPAKIQIDKNEASADATIKLDRTRWNIRYGSGKFFDNLGDKLIFDDFEVRLRIASKLDK